MSYCSGHARTTVATKKGDNPDFVGQMLRDISHFDPDLGMKTQWLYSPEGVADLSEAALKAKSDAIAEKMVALIKRDEKAKMLLKRSLGIVDDIEFENYLNGPVLSSLKQNIKVNDYANVRNAVDVGGS